MTKEPLAVPKFTIYDVRYAADEKIVARAEALYKQGKVSITHHHPKGYEGVVQGSQPYHVWLSQRSIEQGDCRCYMGQNGEFCKHLLALAFAVLDAAGQMDTEPVSLTEAEAKKQIAAGTRKFGPYNGPSRVWFAYQRKLDVGAGLIIEALPFLPPTKDTITYLWKLVLKLSRKCSHGGVDDSNGTLGGCIDGVIERIVEIAQTDDSLRDYAHAHCTDDTGFGFEEDLRVKLNHPRL